MLLDTPEKPTVGRALPPSLMSDSVPEARLGCQETMLVVTTFNIGDNSTRNDGRRMLQLRG